MNAAVLLCGCPISDGQTPYGVLVQRVLASTNSRSVPVLHLVQHLPHRRASSMTPNTDWPRTVSAFRQANRHASRSALQLDDRQMRAAVDAGHGRLEPCTPPSVDLTAPHARHALQGGLARGGAVSGPTDHRESLAQSWRRARAFQLDSVRTVTPNSRAILANSSRSAVNPARSDRCTARRRMAFMGRSFAAKGETDSHLVTQMAWPIHRAAAQRISVVFSW